MLKAPEVVKALWGRQLKTRGTVSAAVRSPVDGKEAESKTFDLGNLDVDSPIGVLASIYSIGVTIFRANHADGGYDCYLAVIFTVNSALGWTNSGWVNPPGGLAFDVSLYGDNGGYFGTYEFPSESIWCADRNKLVRRRMDIDPDLFPLTDSAGFCVLPRSWGRC